MTRSAATLPHDYPFRLLDTVLVERNADFSRGTARARVTAAARMSGGGPWTLSSLVAEVIAQSALLLEGADPDVARTGRLAAIDRLEIARAPEPGDTLDVDIRLARAFGNAVKFDGVVRAGDETIATGSVVVTRGTAPPSA